MGIMEEKMEATIIGLHRVKGLGCWDLNLEGPWVATLLGEFRV